MSASRTTAAATRCPRAPTRPARALAVSNLLRAPLLWPSLLDGCWGSLLSSFCAASLVQACARSRSCRAAPPLASPAPAKPAASVRALRCVPLPIAGVVLRVVLDHHLMRANSQNALLSHFWPFHRPVQTSTSVWWPTASATRSCSAPTPSARESARSARGESVF